MTHRNELINEQAHDGQRAFFSANLPYSRTVWRLEARILPNFFPTFEGSLSGGGRDFAAVAGQSHAPRVILFSMIKLPRRIAIGTVLPGACLEIKAVSSLKSSTA